MNYFLVLRYAGPLSYNLRQGPFVVFDFSEGKRIVLPLDEARAATAELMEQHGVKYEASQDIRDAAEAEAAKEGA